MPSKFQLNRKPQDAEGSDDSKTATDVLGGDFLRSPYKAENLPGTVSYREPMHFDPPLFPMSTEDAEIAVQMAEHHAEDALPDCEIEVLRQVASGNANKIIADKLSISEETVKAHVRKIL
jgi:FixJ family two-component response regulator